MSTQPPAPGWWQASDGNWYPPESHPNAQPAPPPPAPPLPPEPTVVAPQVPAPQQPDPTAAWQQVPPQPDPTATWQQVPPQQPVPQPVVGGPPAPPVPPLPPQAPPASGGSKKPLVIGIVAVGAVAAIVGLVLALSGGDDPKKVADAPKRTTTTEASVEDDSSDGPKIIGGNGSAVNPVVKAAIVDLERFWTDEYPAVFDGEAYTPVKGGFYSVGPNDDLPPCATHSSDIVGNAFYCSKEDVVVDDTDLLPNLQLDFGELAVGVVLADQRGHAIQARSGMDGKTVTLEHQADCYAGAYVANVADQDDPIFDLNDRTVDAALAGFLQLADTPGTSAEDASADGSAFDRVNAFQDGIDNGAESCAAYTDDSITLVEVPFTDPEDADRGGDLPFEDSVTSAITDLEDYWAAVFPGLSSNGEAWQPLADVVPFDDSPPACGTDDTSGYLLYYCAADDTIVFQTSAMQEIHDSIGDFAVGSLLATQYGLAAELRLGTMSDDPNEQNLTADCLAGAWTASVLLENRTTSALSLSPGDLDETVQALLTFGSTASVDNSSQGTGFQRVEAYRAGVIDGVTACSGSN